MSLLKQRWQIHHLPWATLGHGPGTQSFVQGSQAVLPFHFLSSLLPVGFKQVKEYLVSQADPMSLSFFYNLPESGLTPQRGIFF